MSFSTAVMMPFLSQSSSVLDALLIFHSKFLNQSQPRLVIVFCLVILHINLNVQDVRHKDIPSVPNMVILESPWCGFHERELMHPYMAPSSSHVC